MPTRFVIHQKQEEGFVTEGFHRLIFCHGLFAFAQAGDQVRDLLGIAWLSALQGERSGGRFRDDLSGGTSFLRGRDVVFQASLTCFHRSSYEPLLVMTTLCCGKLFLLCGLNLDTLQRILLAHAAFAHQAFHLDLLGGIGDPDRIAAIAQFRFEQLDRFDHNDLLAGTLDEDIDCLADIGMDNLFQLSQRILIGKDKMPELAAVDLSILVEAAIYRTYPAPAGSQARPWRSRDERARQHRWCTRQDVPAYGVQRFCQLRYSRSDRSHISQANCSQRLRCLQ